MKLENIKTKWDMVIVGGGITGAGILREAVRMGLSVLLVEQNDFAWGTSSRSSKMVHGGLRYLKEGDLFLTWASVRERERLIKEVPGLVDPQHFIIPLYKGEFPGKVSMGIGLAMYSMLAMKRQHRYLSSNALIEQVPKINNSGLVGGYEFTDAKVDDARLVLRLIQDSEERGGCALNYTRAKQIHRNRNGRVTHITLQDTCSDKMVDVSCQVVINATGVWAETLHPSPKKSVHIRPLRGSHLVFPAQLFNLEKTVSFVHPKDHRPIFATPWEGVVLVGTTDVDHSTDLNLEPKITKKEVAYLMQGLKAAFPELKIDLSQCIATIAGVRPVLSEGHKDPSQESREHVVWVDNGLVTVTGGKLTTFRQLAVDTLKHAKPYIPNYRPIDEKEPVFVQGNKQIDRLSPKAGRIVRRLYGRYGNMAEEIIVNATSEDLEFIPGILTLWAEVSYVAQHEHVRFLTDLMLRRLRLGLQLKGGGTDYLPEIRKRCEPYLDWDDQKWADEIENYLKVWQGYYSVPDNVFK